MTGPFSFTIVITMTYEPGAKFVAVSEKVNFACWLRPARKSVKVRLSFSEPTAIVCVIMFGSVNKIEPDVMACVVAALSVTVAPEMLETVVAAAMPVPNTFQP